MSVKSAGLPSSRERLSVVGAISRYRKELMGLAALWIFMFHHWQCVLEYIVPNHKNIILFGRNLVSFGYCGVDMFFLLSGIGLVYSIDKNTVPGFYVKRFKRVFIPFLIVYIALAVCRAYPAIEFIKLISGWTFWLENIFDVMWFVPAIMTLYLLFPIYDLVMRKTGSCIIVTAAAIAVWYLASTFLPMRYDLYGATNRVPVFLIGVMLGRLEKDGRFPKSRLLYLTALPLAAGGLYTAYLVSVREAFILVKGSNCFLPPLLLVLALAVACAFILELLHTRPLISKITDICLTPVRYFGSASLEVYLVQMFTVYGIITVNSPARLSGNLILLAVITGASWLLYTASGIIGRLIRYPDNRHRTGESEL